MTRLSEYLLPTEKEAPADAEALSHKLMVRAGLIRQLGAGLWTWLPAGWRTHRKAEQIIREEMDAIGGQELLMPVLHPAELWQKSGRYGFHEQFRLKDRRGADMVLAMTHEEVVTFHVASLVRSYRDLPQILYHLQVKERDEPRPRAGLLRTREFIMKDSYSFDRDPEGLDVSYGKHAVAYERMLDRAGLRWYAVESDVGMMGGHGAHEYMAPCQAGENEVALAPGYAANVEVASAEAKPVTLPAPTDAPEDVHTPGATTVEQVSRALDVPAGALLKAYPVIVEERGLVVVVVRGDHRVNEIKLATALGAAFRPAGEDEFGGPLGPAGYIGPVGAQAPVLLDDAVGETGGYVCGANRADTHLRGVVPGRDFAFERGDVRSVEAGDLVGGHPIELEPAIEVGNIFKLGVRYSEPLGATYLDEGGKARHVWMGSYGMGPARMAAAAVEQYADEQGISWPRSLAPWDVELVGLGKAGSEERELADRLYGELREAGLDVLYDDRDLGPGGKFADAELLGCPLRLTVGRRTLTGGELEAQVRRGQEARSLPLENAAQAAVELWAELPVGPPEKPRPFAAGQTPRERADAARERAQDGAERARLTFRRLSGLDRSGPPPPQTLRGQPLHVWTIPNAIGFARLALIPVFLRSAWRAEGRGRAPATYFAIVAWTDYADGIAARLTGQYSRFGTLLDPLVDRLLTISGVAVCWRFRLLPRTGLGVLLGREASMLWLARWALRQPQGLDSTVNWYGRAGVWPVMAAPFFAMIGRRRVAQACLGTGVPLMLMATVEYLRDVRRQLRARTSS